MKVQPWSEIELQATCRLINVLSGFILPED